MTELSDWPFVTKVVCSEVNRSCVPFGNTIDCSPFTKSSGVSRKHSSVSQVKDPFVVLACGDLCGTLQSRYW